MRFPRSSRLVLSRPRRGAGRPAAAVVEFAVVAPVFFLFVLGILEISRGFMVQHLLLNAARQGCRTGILPSGGQSQVTDAVSATLSPAGISISDQNVSVAVNGAIQDPSTASTGDVVTVTVSVPASSVSWVPAAQFLFGNLSAQYTLRKQ